MAVEKFTGTLDQPASVKKFTGTLDIPPEYPSATSNVSGFVPFENQFPGQSFEQKPSYQLPYPTGMTPEQTATARKGVVPAMAIAGAVPSGGATIPALIGSALGSGIGAGTGKLIEQKLEGKPLDLADAVGEGNTAALWALGGGFVFKGLGALARKAFTAPTEEAMQAARYAKENKIPLPAYTQPGKTGVIGQYVEQTSFPTRIKNINDAKTANTYINNVTRDITKDAKLVDEVAQNGRQFFKNIFSAEKEIGEEGFGKFLDAIGTDTPIAMHKTAPAIDKAIAEMKAEGIAGPLMTKLRTMQKMGTAELPATRMEQLRKDIGKIVTTRKNTNVYDMGQEVIEAIKQDYDEIGAQLGISAREMVDEAIQKYARFSGIKKAYPYLERFSKEFGERGGTVGSKQWFGELFTERNAGALNYIRKEAPELYRELADTRLAQLLDNNTTASTALFGKVLDGEKLLNELAQNKNTMLKIYGTEKYNVLKNFANYVKEVDQLRKTKPIEGTEAGLRIGGMATGLGYAPALYVSGEAAAYVLAKGLSSPRSILYRAFLNKASTKAGKMLQGKAGLSGTLAGQIAREQLSQERGNVGPLELFGNF